MSKLESNVRFIAAWRLLQESSRRKLKRFSFSPHVQAPWFKRPVMPNFLTEPCLIWENGITLNKKTLYKSNGSLGEHVLSNRKIHL